MSGVPPDQDDPLTLIVEAIARCARVSTEAAAAAIAAKEAANQSTARASQCQTRLINLEHAMVNLTDQVNQWLTESKVLVEARRHAHVAGWIVAAALGVGLGASGWYIWVRRLPPDVTILSSSTGPRALAAPTSAEVPCGLRFVCIR